MSSASVIGAEQKLLLLLPAYGRRKVPFTRDREVVLWDSGDKRSMEEAHAYS